MRLLCGSLAYQVLEWFRRVSLAGTQLAWAIFGQVCASSFSNSRRECTASRRHAGGADPRSGAASARAENGGQRRLNSKQAVRPRRERKSSFERPLGFIHNVPIFQLTQTRLCSARPHRQPTLHEFDQTRYIGLFSCAKCDSVRPVTKCHILINEQRFWRRAL